MTDHSFLKPVSHLPLSNFHEVKQIDRPQQESRFTMSSFVGYLEEGPAIILWS